MKYALNTILKTQSENEVMILKDIRETVGNLSDYPLIGILFIKKLNGNPLKEEMTVVHAQWNDNGECAFWNFNNGKYIKLPAYNLVD